MSVTATLLRQMIAYAAALVTGFALYLALIRSPLLGGMHILFYRGAVLAFLAALLLTGLMVLGARRSASLTPSTILSAAALSLSFNLCFLVIVPVTIDRSITVYLLSRIDTQDAAAPMTEERLGQRFSDEYLGSMHQIHRRIEEQSLSGNIAIDRQGVIRLTPRGEGLMHWFRTVGCWFDTDPRFVSRTAPRREGGR